MVKTCKEFLNENGYHFLDGKDYFDLLKKCLEVEIELRGHKKSFWESWRV